MFKNMRLATSHQNKTFETLPRVLKKKLTLSYFLIHSKIKNYFSYKDPIPNDFKSFLVYIYLLVPAVVPSILAKLGVILKLYVLGNYYDLHKYH